MSSANIQFQTIPANIRKPSFPTEFNTQNALQGLTASNDTLVVLAQMTSSGIATVNQPIPIFDSGSAALQFGSGSIAHQTVEAALYSNPNISLYVCPIADALGSAKAAGSFSVDSSATSAGVANLWIADVNIQATYSAGDSTSTIATAIYNQIQANQIYLPVTATVSSGTVNLTARNGGSVGNWIDLNATNSGGLTLTPHAMTAGSGNPSLGQYDQTATPLGAIAAAGFTLIVNTLPLSTPLSKTKDMVEFASSATEQHGCTQVTAVNHMNAASISAVEAIAAALNHGRTTIGYLPAASTIGAVSSPWQLAGAYAADMAATSDPVIPYDGLPLTGIAAPAVIDRLTRSQQENLLNNGIAPFEVASGETVSIVRAISTYTLNGTTPDPTLLDINTMRTMELVRTQVVTRLKSRFQRAKLSPLTPGRVADQIIDVLYLLQKAEIVQNVDTYKAGIIVEQDLSDVNRLDCKIPSNIVSGLHVVASQIVLILGL